MNRSPSENEIAQIEFQGNIPEQNNQLYEYIIWKKQQWPKNSILEGIVLKRIVALVNQNAEDTIIRFWDDGFCNYLEYSDFVVAEQPLSEEQENELKKDFVKRVKFANSFIQTYLQNYEYVSKFKQEPFTSSFLEEKKKTEI